MNSRYALLITLLLSVPQITLSNDKPKNDLAHCKYACRNDMQKLAANDNLIAVGLLYLLTKTTAPNCNCPLDIKGRTEKACIKFAANETLLHDSLDVTLDIPSVGEVSVFDTDQAMEVGYVVAQDVIAKKSGADVLAHAGKTYLREKVVALMLWLAQQTNLENVLPDSVIQSGLYTQVRNELARYGVERLLEKVK